MSKNVIEEKYLRFKKAIDSSDNLRNALYNGKWALINAIEQSAQSDYRRVEQYDKLFSMLMVTAKEDLKVIQEVLNACEDNSLVQENKDAV